MSQQLFNISEEYKKMAVLLSFGKAYKEIACEMKMTEGEVRSYLRRLRLATKCKNSVELIAYLIREKVIE
jgi:DNA-binding CsgD family transcriptional regulator